MLRKTDSIAFQETNAVAARGAESGSVSRRDHRGIGAPGSRGRVYGKSAWRGMEPQEPGARPRRETPSRLWDVVKVVVDPQVVELSVAAPCLMRHT